MAAAPARGDGNFILSQSYWVDAGGGAALADARRAVFQEQAGTVARGYVTEALWLRLRIAGRTDSQPLAVVVKPAFLSEIALYDPDLAGLSAPPMISGRDATSSEATQIGLDNGFVIPAAIQSRYVYLRVKTRTSLTVDIAVMPLDEAQRTAQAMGGILAIYFAFILSFCLWGIVNWGVRGDSLYGLFALRQFHALLHMFVFFGALRYYLSDTIGPEAREYVYTVVSTTVIVTSGYFDMRLIAEFGGARWLRRIIGAALCLPLLGLGLVALGRSQEALQMVSWVVNFVLLAQVCYAFTTREDSPRPFGRAALWLVRAGFTAMMAVVVVPVMMFNNLLHSSVPMFKVMFLHAVISTVILFAILTIRSRQRDLMAQEARLLVQVREAELHQESNRRIEKERFLSMLTHELRNPLSVIRLLGSQGQAGAATVQKAARDMADVIARVEQSERIDGQGIAVDGQPCDPQAIVTDVMQGHHAGPRMQLQVAPAGTLVTDPGLLRGIVENLLDNAGKYSPPGSAIGITLDRGDAGGLRLVVTNVIGDAGPPDPDLLFTKYYRARRACRQPGSGLGLFLVASWARALGGTITYATQAAEDGAAMASFTLWLPQ